MIERPVDKPADVHRRGVDGFVAGDFLAGDEDEVIASVLRQGDLARVDEVVVFAQNEEVISPIEIPAGDVLRRGVRVAADYGVGVGVALVPLGRS